MFLGDVEVFRTSTAEPTPNGTIWTDIKGMSQYNALWKQPQKLIFDLDRQNIHWSFTASFSKQNTMKTPDLILLISAKRSATNLSSAFIVPSDNDAVTINIPATTSRAVGSISACGQIEEESWFSNVFTQDIYTLNSTVGPLYGSSPFREVQLRCVRLANARNRYNTIPSSTDRRHFPLFPNQSSWPRCPSQWFCHSFQ